MTMRVVDRDGTKDKVNGREDIGEQRGQKIEKFVYMAIEILISDHTNAIGKND